MRSGWTWAVRCSYLVCAKWQQWEKSVIGLLRTGGPCVKMCEEAMEASCWLPKGCFVHTSGGAFMQLSLQV